MLSDEKILVTGVSGMVGLAMATALTADNDVWGIARFADSAERGAAMHTDPASRDTLDGLGITTRRVDLAAPDLSDLPDDFTYVLHFAHTRMGSEFLRSVQVNAVGTGHVLQHCRTAKGALVVSSASVYSPAADVFQPLHEDSDMGKAVTPWAPSAAASKISLEAVARFCAEAFDLPTTVARLNTLYGPMGGLPVTNMDAVVAGRTVMTMSDPYPHSPIHIDDMVDQLPALLDAAGSPATIVNWAGDEVVTLQQWSEQAGRLAGREVTFQVLDIPGGLNGNVADVTRRREITGPCRRPFEPSFAEIYAGRHGGAA